MLTCLRVRHLAIIERLEVDLGPGLNVVTGETGAGKSILVTALQLVLGARARPEVVRTDCKRAEVEALFHLPPDHAVRDILQEEGFEVEDELILRRIVRASGGSRAHVNGRLSTVTQLRRIAAELVDISSQHEHTSLVDPGTHLSYLDAFGVPEEQRQGVSQVVCSALDAERTLSQARTRLRDRAEREDLLRFQLSELERVDPKPGELEALRQERDRLRHGERLVRAASQAVAVLEHDDRGVCDRLATVGSELERAATLDAALEPLSERLQAATTELRELAFDLGRYAHDLDVEPERLSDIEERVMAIQRLLRRFDGSEDALAAFRDQATTELSDLDDLDAEVERLEAARDELLRAAAEAARALSTRRRQVAESLAQAITGELHDLGMGHARVQVEVAPLDASSAALEVDGARLTDRGIDRVEFLIAPNPGESPRPLARVASGGELSRALLALKRVLAGAGPVGLYVFDEVDTGVGGAVAEAIGRKIREVAGHHQVLCITHQPQIAAFGDTHLHVHKAVSDDGRTRSRVQVLDAASRQEELARMLSGATLTDAARDAASALLDQARESRP